MEYTIILDGINDYAEMFYYVDENDIFSNYDTMIEDIKACLRDTGGGHADIFNEDGNFVDDIEV